MDIMRTIHEAYVYAAQPGTQFSDGDLFSTYMQIIQTAFGHESGLAEHLSDQRIECIVYILQKYGVGYDTSSLEGGFTQIRRAPAFTQKIGKVFRIADRAGVERIEHIVRLIAGGFPLIGLYPAGRAFDFVNGDEIYDAPPNTGINHCVVLMGSGVEEYPGPGKQTEENLASRASWPSGRGPRIYLRARGSWDDGAHP